MTNLNDKCLNYKNTLKHCNCTYESCSRKGLCCECIKYHRDNNELPGCYFNKYYEKTFDRSINNFLKMHGA